MEQIASFTIDHLRLEPGVYVSRVDRDPASGAVITTFDLRLEPAGTDFQRQVWDALRTIPYGATETYGHLAERIGHPRGTRAVGAATGRNPISIIVPCHRLVGASGGLTGYAGGLDRKRWLLDLEAGGVLV